MTVFSLVTGLTAKKAKTHGLTSDQTFVTKSKRYCGTTSPEIQQNKAKTIFDTNKTLRKIKYM